VKVVRLLLVAVMAVAIPVLRTGSADAAAPSNPYPPALCATLSISTTTPFPGQTITVTGVNFKANENISLVYDTGRNLADVRVPASGRFSVGVQVPQVTGNHMIFVQGDHSVCPPDPIQINVQTTTGGGGGLSSTGANVLTAIVVAIALLAGGILLTRSGRRRSSSRH
jgi:hypothetical protein